MSTTQDRQERINRAREMMRANPYMTRHDVNAQLRREYGQGIRFSEITRINREYNRVSYVKSLLHQGAFLPKEVKAFKAAINRGHKDAYPSYLLTYIRERHAEAERFRDQGGNQKQWRRYIKNNIYNEFLTTTLIREYKRVNPNTGKTETREIRRRVISPSKLIKLLRKQAIDNGEYEEPKAKKKGDTISQGSRYRARKKADEEKYSGKTERALKGALTRLNKQEDKTNNHAKLYDIHRQQRYIKQLLD